MAFITLDDMKSHIYQGASNIISQGNTKFLTDAISAAITYAKGYCGRYNISALFGDEAPVDYIPDPILQMHVKNLAKWYYIGLANPSIDYDDARTRHDDAVKWLLEVQGGRAVPPGWPPATPVEKSTFFHIQSNPKRNNHI